MSDIEKPINRNIRCKNIAESLLGIIKMSSILMLVFVFIIILPIGWLYVLNHLTATTNISVIGWIKYYSFFGFGLIIGLVLKSMPENITKKEADSAEGWRFRDWFWLTGILISIIILVVTSKIGTNENINELFSFAANLVSILLGLVAIGYAFHQSSQAKVDNKHITNIMHDITNKITVLDEIKHQIALVGIQKNMTTNDFLSDMNNFLRTIEFKDNTGVEKIVAKLKEYEQEIVKQEELIEKLKQQAETSVSQYNIPHNNTYDLTFLAIGDNKSNKLPYMIKEYDVDRRLSSIMMLSKHGDHHTVRLKLSGPKQDRFLQELIEYLHPDYEWVTMKLI